MQFIEWKPEMSVCSDILDGHHKMIIDCLNQLHPLLEAEGNDDEIHAVVEKLENFILVHFSEEEQTMKHVGYPGWKEHRELHDQMYDVVFNLKADVEHGRSVDAKALFELVYNWLLQHIMGADKKYSDYILHPRKEQGVWHRANGRDV